jgi:uncharacterized protein
MKIKRHLSSVLQEKLQKGKVVLLYGPRRVGKTTLIHDFLNNLPPKEQGHTLLLNGELHTIQERFSVRSIERLRGVIGSNSLLIIDEAQNIPDIGTILKLIVDHIPHVQILASGSASFALARQVGEPLTGRKKTLHLYPVWAREIITTHNELFYRDTLERSLVYGAYPELFLLESDLHRMEYMRDLVSSYLFRDILALEDVRNPKKLRDLLTLLAFQIGKEVSLSELSRTLELHKQTVFRYLDLLEQSFIVLNIRGFSRNLRKEVTKTSRYYFYDNGVRNALINNFNPLDLRDDIGMLWKNYIVMERIKKQAYESLYANNYFWRTYDQKEIDFVEEREGALFGFEITWNERSKKQPSEWLKTYPNASYEVIHRDNYLDFIA